MSLSISLKKAIAASFSVLIFGQVALVDASQASLWNDRRASGVKLASLPLSVPALSTAPSALPMVKTAHPMVSPVLAALNPEFGSIRDVRIPQGAVTGVVVNIQDVHRNAEAQENIRRATLSLVGAGVGTAALEGAEGEIRIAPLRAAISLDDRSAVARFFLKQDRISGPAAAAIATELPLRLVGVDDVSLHASNAKAYRDSLRFKGAFDAALVSARLEVSDRKAQAFSPALAHFDDFVERHRTGALSFGDHVALVAKQAGHATSAVTTFLQASAIEKSLDVTAVETDRRIVIERIAAASTKADLTRLLDLTVALRIGRASSAEFYGELARLCQAARVPLNRFPAFAAYVRYVSLSDRIRPEALLADVARLEKDAYKTLLRSAAERRLVEESRWLELAGKLSDFSLSAPEWAEYVSAPLPAFAPSEGTRAPFESFYRVAGLRDQAIARRTLAALAGTPNARLTLVTGGFHASGIQERLLDAGVAVVSFTPRLTRTADGAAYLSVFAREKTPLETLFTGERLFLASHPFPDDVRSGAFPAATLGRAALQGRAPASPSAYVQAAAPDAGLTGADVRIEGGAANVRLDRTNGSVVVGVRLGGAGDIAAIDEQRPTGTYALGYRLLGQFQNWRRLTEVALAWIVELPAVIAAAVSPAAFERLLQRHPGATAETRATLLRLAHAVRGGLAIGAVSGATAAVLLNGPSLETRLLLSAFVTAALGAAIVTLSTASVGHLGQNIFGIALTTGDPARGAPRYLRNARIFASSGEDVVLPARFELAPIAVAEAQLQSIGERVIDIVARRRVEGTAEEGRSLVEPLAEPITIDGRTFDVLVLKRVTYRGSPPSVREWTPTEGEAINQPTVVLRTNHDDMITMNALWRRATGTGPMSDSIAEFREMRRAGRLAPYSIGIGELPTLVTDDGRTMGFIVYLDNAGARPRAGAASRAQMVRLRSSTMHTIGPDIQDAMEVVGANARSAARALQQLHDEAGMVHQAPHPDQFGVAVDGRSRIYDLDDAVWVGRLTRNQYIFLRINDFLQTYVSFHRLANRANAFGPANMFYDEVLPAMEAENPLRTLIENYFTPDQTLAIGFPRIWELFRPRASASMPYSRFWSPFGDAPTPFSVLDRDIWTVAEQIGGAAYDRFMDERVLAPLVRAGIPADLLRPYLHRIHERALRQGSLSARDVVREMRGAQMRRGWAEQIARAVSAYAEVPAAPTEAPMLVLPVTEWLVGYAYRLANPFSAFLSRNSTLPSTRASVRRIAEVAGSAVVLLGHAATRFGRLVSQSQRGRLESAWSRWLKAPNGGREHLEARRQLAEQIRRLPVTTDGTRIRTTLLKRFLRMYPESEPYEIAGYADIAHGIVPLIPFTGSGDRARAELLRSALPLLKDPDFWVRNRALNLIDDLLSRLPRQSHVRLAFPAIAALLEDGDHGTSINAGRLLQRLLPHVPSAQFALEVLHSHRRAIAQRRPIPNPSGSARALFESLHDLAERGDSSGLVRGSWMSKSRDASARLLGRLWFRSLVVPGIELPALPGLVFIYFGLVSLAAPALTPWLAPVLAGVMFSVFHGVPGDDQTWKAAGARAVAATAISGAALFTALGISGLSGLGTAFLVAYVLHGVWNAVAPRAWRLTLGDKGEAKRDDAAQARAAALVLDALAVLDSERPDAAAFADRLNRLAAETDLNQDVSSVAGRMAALTRSGLLDGDALAVELSAGASARGGALTLSEAREAVQGFAFQGAAATDIEDALRDSSISDSAADIAVVPSTLSIDAELRLLTVLAARQSKRAGRGEAIALAGTDAQAARLRGLGVSGVRVIAAPLVLGGGRSTVDLARVATLLGEHAVDLNNFSNVNVIAPAGHTLLVDGLSPDLPWVRRAVLLLIDDLLQAVSTTLPSLYQLERAARIVASQA